MTKADHRSPNFQQTMKQRTYPMKKLILLTATAFLFSGAAYADGSHTGGHGNEVKKDDHHTDGAAKDDHHAGGDDHHSEMTVGEAGKESDVRRTVTITMKETDDGGMIFEPKSLDVIKGQTVKFVVKNVGELEHEFVLDDHKSVMKHKAVMEKFPEMEHDDPNAVRLEPAKSGEIIWKFTNGGKFEFACLIPGHYEAGMKGDIAVVEKSASN